MDAKRERSRWRLKAGRAIGVTAVLALGYFVRLYLYPYDEVVVEVRDVPADTAFVCLVADWPGGPVLMPWSLAKVFPFTMHPDECTVSYRWGGEAGPHRGAVRWASGGRVGVLLGGGPGRWRVAWYEDAAARVRGGSWVFGGGSWRPSLLEAAGEQPLDEAALRGLGLDYALRSER